MPKKNVENAFIGWFATIYGISTTMAHFKVKRDKVKYWRHKVNNPSFHPKEHGGWR